MLKTDKDIRTICSACGTSPVNHNFIFSLNLVDEFFSIFDTIFLTVTQNHSWESVASWVEKFLFKILSLVKIVRYNKTDLDKSVTGRSKLVWETAQKQGIMMEQVIFLWKPIEYYRAKVNGHMHYFHSLPIPPWLPQTGYAWLDDKFTLAKALSKVGIPTPKTRKISSLTEARKAFEEMEKPLIIKPKFGSRGRHTTTNINTLVELENAFRLARQISYSMVLQEHLFGSVYRATVINNKLVGFYRADPPQIIGDGTQTIRELITDKNAHRRPRVSEILMNDDMKNFISRKGYTPESVLPEGIILDLSAKTGRMYGSYTKEMFSEVHPKMHEIFAKAGQTVQAPVVGFDLIIIDPTKDPDTQKWGIIECNSLPYIDLHFFALEGTPLNLAENVWDLWNTPH